ncbi:MAG: TIGR00159 family protein [Candidatus Dadabacteria bacterium]|nr:TIGR00159 family protein [Candidatus Dadabacteria bacterium]NIQ13006.1 TIGR00159 family protein [Candidatus Dadabacteria bacterium]
MLDSLVNFRYVWDTLDIFIVALIFYYILRIIEGTRASQILIGFFLVVILFFVSQIWGLFTLNWLLGHFLGSIILITVILFQNDIRKALARIGKRPIIFSFTKHDMDEAIVDELVKASSFLSSKKIGALIAVERSTNLNDFVEIGMKMDADVSRELIISIFNPDSPLHDGAIIIRNNKILSAGSFFPIVTDPDLERELGTRHRAAIGLSTETDALVIVVSEETGLISLSIQGEISRGLDASTLNNKLLENLGIKKFENQKEI